MRTNVDHLDTEGSGGNTCDQVGAAEIYQVKEKAWQGEWGQGEMNGWAIEIAMATLCMVGLCVWLVLYGASRWRKGQRTSEEAWLPKELRSARLVASERKFTTNEPVEVGAIIDRLYEKPDGALVLVEVKSRKIKKTYMSDVVEMSVQRLAVQGEWGNVVSDVGYVVVVGEKRGTEKCIPVQLLTAGKVIELLARREELLAGRRVPVKVAVRGICERCGYLNGCKPAFKE
jgi:CRISPR-associated exonuclease Cas4